MYLVEIFRYSDVTSKILKYAKVNILNITTEDTRKKIIENTWLTKTHINIMNNKFKNGGYLYLKCVNYGAEQQHTKIIAND